MSDVSKHKGYAQVLEQDFGEPEDVILKWVRAETCFPLIVQGELVGTLNMHWCETKNFDNGELSRLIRDLANRSAIAIKAALMFEEIDNKLNRKIDSQERLREIGLEFAQTLDVDILLNRLLDNALTESGLSSGLIRILDEDKNKWVLKAARDDSPEPLTEKLAQELEVRDDILQQAANAASATRIPDTKHHTGFKKFIDEYPGTKHRDFHQSFRSAVVVPIKLKARCIGLLILNSKALDALPDSTIKYLELLAGQAAIAIHNAQLYAASERSLQLAQPLAILGSMMGSFLHETRTPLQRLTGSLNVTQHRNFDKARLQDYLRKMREQVEAVAGVLSDFALFARSDSTALRESVELNSVIEKAVRDRGHSFGKKINCTLNLADPSPIAKGNRAQLERVFKLVIGNAVDAMSNGGDLLIQTNAGSDPDRVVVSFKDSGSGMDAQTKAKCLELYFTTKQGGTGLGLSVVSLIVSHHSGKIHIESEPGQGTTVTLTFQKGRE
jgi:signal transduction histidine kinase